ncbi:MAG: 30S ribosomal protein S9 [Minisyncoccia bacterium]
MSEIKTEKVSKRYIETVGRRKTSIARVRITPSTKSSFTVNGKTLDEFFKTEKLKMIGTEAIKKFPLTSDFTITAKIIGGGSNSQAEALRHGLARAIIIYDATMRKDLKKAGFLKRDPRSKERRKFGLKKARKAPQWSKR